MRKSAALLVVVLFVSSGLAVVEIGPGQRIFQSQTNFEITFSQDQNFSKINLYDTSTQFESSNFSAVTEDYEPVAYYPLDGSGRDTVGDSEITSGSAAPAEGYFGGSGEARYFDGSSYLKVENPDFGIDETQSVTIMMWQKGDGQPKSDASFAGHDASGNQRQIWAHAPYGGEKVFWDSAGTIGAGRISWDGSGTAWNDWHHFTFVHNADNGRKEIWFNGNKVASSPSTKNFNEIVDFYIGAPTSGPSGITSPYNGRIDNLAIYNRSLPSDVIKKSFNSSKQSRKSAEPDFYRPQANLQEYVTNFTAATDKRSFTEFKISDLPGDLFYEAFNSDTDNRYFIGYANNSYFNFTVPNLMKENISVFHYGEKGVAVDNITFNSSDPVEGETVGVESGIFNEGVVEDEAVNKTLTISTYNGSGWQQKQFRSNIVDVPNNTETEKSLVSNFSGSFERTTDDYSDGSGVRLGYDNGTSGDSLIAYYRMDEAESGSGGTVADYSGNKNDATAEGLKTGATGVLGTKGLQFNSSVNQLNSGGISSTSKSYTFSGWVKRNNSGYIFDTETGRLVISLGEFTKGGELSFYDGSWKSFGSDAFISEERWTQFAIVFNATEGRAEGYLDGTSVGTLPYSGKNIGGATTIGSSFSGVVSPFVGTLDEFRIYNRSLSSEEVRDLHFLERPISGSYSTEVIEENKITKWFRVDLDADVHEGTDLNMTFRALDGNNSLIEKKTFDVESGGRFYGLEKIEDTKHAKIVFNGTSSDPTRSWSINSLRVISGGPYIDQWEAKPGPWRFNVSLDPNDKVKETNETNNNASEVLNVDSYQVLYGGSDLSVEVGANTDDMYVWNPENSQGFLYFADVDSDFDFGELKPIDGSNFYEVDKALKMLGHNDSVQEVWDPNGDGSADQTRNWTLAGREMEVPMADSTSAGSFHTGILFDSSVNSSFTGSEDLVFVTKLKPATVGKFGRYDYEARIPFGLRNLKSGSDRVTIYEEPR